MNGCICHNSSHTIIKTNSILSLNRNNLENGKKKTIFWGIAFKKWKFSDQIWRIFLRKKWSTWEPSLGPRFIRREIIPDTKCLSSWIRIISLCVFFLGEWGQCSEQLVWLLGVQLSLKTPHGLPWGVQLLRLCSPTPHIQCRRQEARVWSLAREPDPACCN